MEQRTFLALTAMLNSFPQSGSTDHEVLLRTHSAVLREVSVAAVAETAQRFTSGLVPGQNLTFAPSVAEFANEARKTEESIKRRAKSANVLSFHRASVAPFEMRRRKALLANADREVILVNATFEEFKRRSVARELPVGAQWVACLATIYGPVQSVGKAS